MIVNEFLREHKGGAFLPDLLTLLDEFDEDKCSVLAGKIRAQTQLVECTEENPCCDRRGEYNGFGSGPLRFICPKHCPCHD